MSVSEMVSSEQAMKPARAKPIFTASTAIISSAELIALDLLRDHIQPPRFFERARFIVSITAKPISQRTTERANNEAPKVNQFGVALLTIARIHPALPYTDHNRLSSNKFPAANRASTRSASSRFQHSSTPLAKESTRSLEHEKARRP